MRVLTIDFETYWNTRDQYSLARCDMTALDYIMDERFQIICVSAKVDDGPVLRFSGHQLEQFDQWLSEHETEKCAVRSHNGVFFDFLILGWIFGIRPARWEDTMLMARPLLGPGQRATLAALAQLYGLPAKGGEIYNTDGKRLEDFTAPELDRFMAYCDNDVELCYALGERLKVCWAERDLCWMDICCRMGSEPRFILCREIISDGIQREIKRQENIYFTLAQELAARSITLPDEVWRPRTVDGRKIYPELDEAVKKAVSSPVICSSLIERLGHYVPMQFSEKQDKHIPYLSKSNPDFTGMVDFGDPALEALVEARLASRNTIRMSRLTRMRTIGEKMGGKMPVFLEPFAALTGRNAGKQGMNIQNISSRVSASNPEGKANPLRCAMRAPDGHVVIDADSSQIEVRVLAAVSGEEAISGPLSRGEDIYCAFASSFYGRPITPSDKYERTVAKAAVLGNGYGQGAFGFQRYAKVVMGVNLSLDEAQEVVDGYRRHNSNVVAFWRACDGALDAMERGTPYSFGANNCITVEGTNLILPSGRRIYYRELRWQDQINPQTGEVVGRERVYYDTRKRAWRRIYGSLMCENICQAGANDIISEQAVAIFKRSGISPVAQVHDALVYIVPDSMSHSFLLTLREEMSTTPTWLPFVPLGMGAEMGPSYGEMKEYEYEE